MSFDREAADYQAVVARFVVVVGVSLMSLMMFMSN
jgi:hypothetical protein